MCASHHTRPSLIPLKIFLRWKVYDRNPYAQENLIQSMDAACDNIGVEAIQGWIRHAKGFFPRCLARDRIACDVDEALWPDHAQRHDAEAEWFQDIACYPSAAYFVCDYIYMCAGLCKYFIINIISPLLCPECSVLHLSL